MFAALSVAISLSSNTVVPVRLLPEARRLSVQAAAVLTVVALGAGAAWAEVFLRSSTHGIPRLLIAIAIAAGIAAQPAFAWRLAMSLRS